MEPTQRLSDYLNQGVNQDVEGSSQQLQNFQTFITLFGINLVHRYPGVVDLNTIDVPTIQNIARLSAVCSTVATEVWNDIASRSRRGGGVRQTRAA